MHHNESPDNVHCEISIPNFMHIHRLISEMKLEDGQTCPFHYLVKRMHELYDHGINHFVDTFPSRECEKLFQKAKQDGTSFKHCRTISLISLVTHVP
jgi:hypothetical protein